jgi:hypothetical protein
VKVQASGAVASLDAPPAAAAAGCDGIIIGGALYEGRFTVAEAREAGRCPPAPSPEQSAAAPCMTAGSMQARLSV